MVRERSGGARVARGALRAVVVAGFLFMLLPIVLVVWLSFFANQILALPPTGYTLRWYGALLAQPQFVGGFVTSLEVALLATAAGLLVSVPASLALVRTRFPGREAALQFLMSPLVVPAIVIGAGLYMFFIEAEIRTEIPFVGSTLGLAVAHILITIPWCVRLVTANLVGVDPAVEEAAQSLGATPLATWRLVTLPLAMPGVLAAVVLSFILTMNAYATPVLLGGPSFRMMAPVIADEILAKNNWPFGATLAFLLMLVTLGLTGLMNVVISRRYVGKRRLD